MVTRSTTRVETATPGRGPGRGRGSSTGPRPTGPIAGRAAQAAARDLLADAGRGLDSAIRATDTADRYAAAHLAGLRAAAALLAVRTSPAAGRGGRAASTPRSRSTRGNVWDQLERVAPELGEWSAFYRAGIPKRQLAEAGIGRAIGVHETDDLIRRTGEFIELVESLLAVPRVHAG